MDDTPRADVVAVIPALNCEASLAAVVGGLRQFLTRVIVVDDGSTDTTAQVAREAGAEVSSLPENCGKGAALRHGLELALASPISAVALVDGDGQHAPGDLPELLLAWDSQRYDLVIGHRLSDRDAIPGARFWTNYIGSRILSWMTGRELLDSQSGYRVLSAPLARRLGMSAAGYAIETEMLLKATARGARIGHAPIRTIYQSEVSHFRPLRDTFVISCLAIFYKVFDDP